jgi:hypothetical protein
MNLNWYLIMIIYVGRASSRWPLVTVINKLHYYSLSTCIPSLPPFHCFLLSLPLRTLSHSLSQALTCFYVSKETARRTELLSPAWLLIFKCATNDSLLWLFEITQTTVCLVAIYSFLFLLSQVEHVGCPFISPHWHTNVTDTVLCSRQFIGSVFYTAYSFKLQTWWLSKYGHDPWI